MYMCKEKWSFIKLLVTYFIGICSFIFILFASPPFIIYRHFLNKLLKYKHGEKYGGLFDIEDIMYMPKDKNKMNVILVFILKSHEEINAYEYIKEMFETQVFCFPRPYPKLTSTYRMNYGYLYYIKDDLEVSDCLKFLPAPEGRKYDEAYLKDLVSTLYNSPFPKGDTSLWDLHISRRPLEGYLEEGYHYPFILRFNHGLMDGASAGEFLIRLLAKNNTENYAAKIFNNYSSKEETIKDLIVSKMKKLMNICWLTLYIMFIGIGRFLESTYLIKENENALHSSNLSGEKILEWRIERNAISKIKAIKNRIPNTKFTSILMTAVTSSLTAYLKRNGSPIQDGFKTVLSVLPSFPEMDKSKPVPLRNYTAFLGIELPTSKNSLLENLRTIEIRAKKELSYPDKVTSRILLKCSGLLPLPLSGLSLGDLSYTAVISNTPGFSQLHLENGVVIDSFSVNIPNLKATGISLILMTYGEKLIAGLTVDKSILAEREEVKRLVDDIFLYIDKIDLESRKMYGD